MCSTWCRRRGRAPSREKRGLITANNRWCGVDWLTCESVAVKGVHVLGDATLSAPANAEVREHGEPARQGVRRRGDRR